MGRSTNALLLSVLVLALVDVSAVTEGADSVDVERVLALAHRALAVNNNSVLSLLVHFARVPAVIMHAGLSAWVVCTP